MAVILKSVEGASTFIKNTGLVKRVFGFDQKEAFMKTYALKDLNDQQPVANVLAVFGEAEQRYREQLATLTISEILPITENQPLQLDWTKWLLHQSTE